MMIVSTRAPSLSPTLRELPRETWDFVLTLANEYSLCFVSAADRRQLVRVAKRSLPFGYAALSGWLREQWLGDLAEEIEVEDVIRRRAEKVEAEIIRALEKEREENKAREAKEEA